MKLIATSDLTRNTDETFIARSTGHCTRVALDVTDMPEDLGRLLDKGIEDYFRDR